MDLIAKNVLITGGAKRVGAALVEGFVNAKANVLLHYNSSYQEALAMQEKFPTIKLIQANLNNKDDVKRLANSCKDINILINNASYYDHFDLQNSSTKVFEKYMQINYHAPVELINSLTKDKQNEKVVINFLDQILLKDNYECKGGYFQSRKSLLGATYHLAKELGTYNIRVNGIAVGPVIPPESLADQSMSKTIPTLPLKRKVDLQDLVASVLFLTTNSSITGAVLPVDCGQHLI